MTQSSPTLSPESLETLRRQLDSTADRTRLQALEKLLAAGETATLLTWLDENHASGNLHWLAGSIYLALSAIDDLELQQQLASRYPTGIVTLVTERGIDYEPIQQELLAGNWEEADRLTSRKLCELAGPDALKRKWVYYTEADTFPVGDLQTLDRLWWVYSQGRFGFRVQKEIWLGVGQDWDQLWPKIHWKNGNTWTRYPGSFTWDLSAPRGHLPLTNQLRGVRVMSALMNHPAFA